MLTTIAQDPTTSRVPISGIGGITTWKDAAEFMLLGATTPAGMHRRDDTRFPDHRRPVRRIKQLDGRKRFSAYHRFHRSQRTHAHQLGKTLDINFHIVADIDQQKCIHCGLCYIACEDTSHQAISIVQGQPYNTYSIKEEECVGCNLCKLCGPVDSCITMVEQRKGPDYLNWKEYQRRGLAVKRSLIIYP